MIVIKNKTPLIRCYTDGRREVAQSIEFIYAGCRLTVPEGFICDGSSIPRVFWRVCGSPTTGPNLLAGVCHDWLYTSKPFDRPLCDKIFYELLLELKKPKLIAWVMWKAVSVFGGRHW